MTNSYSRSVRDFIWSLRCWISLWCASSTLVRSWTLNSSSNKSFFAASYTSKKTSSVEVVFVIGSLYIQNNRSTSSPLENNGVPRGRNAVEHSDSTWLVGHERPPPAQGRDPSLSGRFYYNEHGFLVVVTSLNKIGGGRIQDRPDNVLFPVTFKCIVLVAVTSFNKISEGRIWDHIGASCPTLSECKPIILQRGSNLTKSLIVYVVQILLTLFDTISEKELWLPK